MTKSVFTWGVCSSCGGDLPLIDGDNDSYELPKRLRFGGQCPGSITPEGNCGAYWGWSTARIEAYVQRHGARVQREPVQSCIGHVGPRLPEGCTELPEGARLEWWIV